MAFFLPQGPPPAVNANVRYQYHTLDGGPPNGGKPPDAPPGGPPPPYSPFPFCTNPPAPGVGFPFCTGPPAPAPGPFAFCAPPPAPNPTTFCWGTKAPEPPKSFVLTASAPVPPSRTLVVGGSTSSRNPHPPDPGNRVNNRVVKADDGTGVLCAEEMTTFHVLNPGRWFDDNMTVSSLQKPRDFIVQHVDSDWTVQKFIERLGGLEKPRLSADQVSRSDSLICVEEWHEAGNGRFERGSNVFYNEPKARMSLKTVGWGPEHGKAGQKPPVWVMLYPINNDVMNR